MQPEVVVAALTAVGGALQTVRVHYRYKTALLERQHANNHEIEDRREKLEDTRKKNYEEWVSRFEGAIKSLRDDISSLQSRFDQAEPKIETLDKDVRELQPLTEKVQALSENMEKFIAWIERRKDPKPDAEPGKSEVQQLAPDIVRVTTKKGGG